LPTQPNTNVCLPPLVKKLVAAHGKSTNQLNPIASPLPLLGVPQNGVGHWLPPHWALPSLAQPLLAPAPQEVGHIGALQHPHPRSTRVADGRAGGS